VPGPALISRYRKRENPRVRHEEPGEEPDARVIFGFLKKVLCGKHLKILDAPGALLEEFMEFFSKESSLM
jgi:hypothetical protein